MDDFLTWCSKNQLDTTLPAAGQTVEEGSTKRAGVRSHAYPELYSRGQYTKAGLRPTAADAVTYQDLDKKGD
jgi:hypothetical protein